MAIDETTGWPFFCAHSSQRVCILDIRVIRSATESHWSFQCLWGFLHRGGLYQGRWRPRSDLTRLPCCWNMFQASICWCAEVGTWPQSQTKTYYHTVWAGQKIQDETLKSQKSFYTSSLPYTSGFHPSVAFVKFDLFARVAATSTNAAWFDIVSFILSGLQRWQMHDLWYIAERQTIVYICVYIYMPMYVYMCICIYVNIFIHA